MRRNRTLLLALLALALTTASCGGGGESAASSPGTPSVSATPSGARPASTAKLSIVSPKNGAVIHGTTVVLKVSLKDAKIVQPTSSNIVPDEGHLHVILDDELISMTGDTQQVLTDLTPGQHLLKVEFVASDHFPFDPRVIAAVAFEVKP